MGGRINGKSPQAQRMLKFAFNLLDDGLVGQQLFAGEATRLAYMTDEAVEGRDAFLEKRAPRLDALPAVLLIPRARANVPHISACRGTLSLLARTKVTHRLAACAET